MIQCNAHKKKPDDARITELHEVDSVFVIPFDENMLHGSVGRWFWAGMRCILIALSVVLDWGYDVDLFLIGHMTY